MKVFATSLAGKVQNIHGRVIINNNGAIETVVLGQFIPAGAVLQCDANATLTLTTDDHRHIFFDGQESHITPTVIDGRNTDVAAIQSLITSGDDPTKHAKASAAGNPTHAGGFGYVTLQRNGDEVLAKTDFSTSGQHRDEHLNTELFDIEVHQTGLVIKGETYTVPEDNKVVLNLLDNDTSVSGDPLSIHSINGTPLTGSDQTIVIEHGHITITADGTITFIPEPNFNGEVNVDYTVTDGTSEEHGHSSVIVTPVNDAPVANPDSFTTNEDTSITVDLIKNDHDVDGDTVTIKEINGTPVTPGHEQTIVVDNGKIVIADDGSTTFVPSDNYHGDVTVPYTITDGDKTATSTVTIHVTAVNDAPVANPDSFTTNEDTSITVNLTNNDSDVDGDTVTIKEINGTPVTPGHEQTIVVDNGKIVIADDGGMTFIPSDNYHGDVTVPYTITDGDKSATSTVTIHVTPINDAPVANPDSFTTDEDTSITVDLTKNDHDVDGDTVTIKEINGTPVTPGHEQTIVVDNGKIVIAHDGGMTFVPSDNYHGDVTVPYTITDGDKSATSTVTIHVMPINDAPVANPDSFTTDEDTSITVDLTKNDHDVDGDTLTIKEINGTPVTPGHEQTIVVDNGKIVIAHDGGMTFVPSDNYHGDVTVPYTITDGDKSASSTATIHVTPINDAPVANPDSFTTDEDTSITVDLTKNDHDVDGDTLTIKEINGTPVTPGHEQTIVVDNGKIVIAHDGGMTFVPSDNYHGDVTVPYTITDGDKTATSTVTIHVMPINDAPVANPDSFTTGEDTSITVDLTKNDHDVDGDTVIIKEINGTPVTPGHEQTIVVDNGKIVIAHDGGMTFVPSDNYHGDVTVPYTITDGDKTATSTVTIHVTPVNDAPVANLDSFTTNEDTSITVDLTKNDHDVDGDKLTIKEINGTPLTGGEQTVVVDNGKIVIADDGGMTFVPRDNYHGDVTVPYTITDGDKTATSTVTIHVMPINDAPVSNPDSFTTGEDTSITVDLTKNDHDVDGDTVIIKEINGTPVTPGHEQTIVVDNGKIVIADDGGMTFIPSDNYHGDVTVPYTITDGDKTATSTVTIHVTPVNDAPVANPDSFTTDEDTSITVDLIKNDHDIDGDKLTIKEINGTPLTGGEQTVVVDNGKIVIAHDGSTTFIPSDNYHGDETVPYTITDGDKTATSTVTIHVTPVNDAPVANPDSFTTDEDTSITVDLIKNDHDVDGDTLTIKEINGTPVTPGHEQTIVVDNGKIVIAHDGGMIFIPSGNYHGDVTVPYTITDGDKTATSTVTIHVTPVNDEPVANPDSFTTDEDTSITVDLIKNDHDIDGDKLTVKEINGTSVTLGHEQTIVVDNGKIVIADDGGMTFVPSDNYHGDVTVPYTITDGDKTASSTATIHVTPINDAPVANPDSFTTDEDTSITVDLTNNDSDVDGDKLTVKEINGIPLTGGEQTIVVDHGKIVIADDGGMTFIPSDNYHGDVTVPYTITDGDKTATSTVIIHVTPVNDAPVANPDSFTTDEDTSITVNLTNNDSDVDGDKLTVKEINGTSLTGGEQTIVVDHGKIVIAHDGDMTFVPSDNYHGDVTVPYTITDGDKTATSTVTIHVTPVNDAPVANPDSFTTNEDTSITVDLTKNDSDVDGDRLTVKEINGTLLTGGDQTVVVDNGKIVIAHDGGMTFIPSDNYHGDVTVPYTITDGDKTATSTVTIHVTPVNDAPIANPDSFTTDEDTSITVDLTKNDSDVDGDKLTIKEINGTPLTGDEQTVVVDNGKIVISDDGDMTFVPNKDYNGTVDVNYTITDGDKSASSTATIHVTPVNDAPVANDKQSFSYDENSTTKSVLGTVSVNDPENDELSFTISKGNEQGWFTIDNHGHIYLTDAGVKAEANDYEVGKVLHTLEVSVSDSHNTTSIQVDLTERDVNEVQTTYKEGSYGNDVLNGDSDNNIIISDKTGLQVVQGENYNIAFILDTSSSMYWGNDHQEVDGIRTAVIEIDKVLSNLKTLVSKENAAHINIGLIDFNTNAITHTIDLYKYHDGDLLKKFNENEIRHGGSSTNYEDAFEHTTEWFNSDAVLKNKGNNTTYFFTDGKPNTANSDDFLEQIIHIDINKESLEAFDKLKVVSPSVEAIGIMNSVNASDLEPYDTDGKVHANINASEISDIVLGKETQLTQGDDIVHGRDGNDIIFGDIIKLDSHEDLQGFAALKEYIESKSHIGLDKLSNLDISDYIQTHIKEFDVSHQHDGNDVLYGDKGNDILFGQGGDDKLFGGEGNDIIIGGTGNDELTGGLGQDTFAWFNVHQTSVDTIKDFNVKEDHLDLSDLLHSVKDNELDKFLTLRQDGKNTDIAINNDGKGDIEQHIILDNVNSNDVVKNIGVITNNLLHSDGDKLILNTHQDLHTVMPEHHPLISIHHEEQIS
ncbi:retention module-containing protein [Photobacterium leiognathi]|uniref:retention module-containing protein n=12 Tax=Photobacterium leiognathi TaxID=553611 RepID=UPI002982210C|nr:retention module-containing protein [Photobacterium leiognathi]